MTPNTSVGLGHSDLTDLDEGAQTILQRLRRNPKNPRRIAPILFFVCVTPLLYINWKYSTDFLVLPANLIKDGTVYCLLAIGASIVLSTSQIDLSSIGVATISGVIFASILSYGPTAFSPPFILYGVLASLLFAIISGLCVAFCFLRLRAPLLILTWALGSVYVVGSVLITPLAGSGSSHDTAGVGLPAQLPEDFWGFGGLGFYLAIVAIAVALILPEWSNLRRRAAAIGASETSARYAGIPNGRTYCEVFTVNAMLACIAGIFHALWLNKANTRDLMGNELIPIAIAVLGGTSLSGGFLYIPSVIAGAFFWTTTRILGPRLPELFPILSTIQAELGQILFYAIFIVVSLVFGRLLAPPISKIFALREN